MDRGRKQKNDCILFLLNNHYINLQFLYILNVYSTSNTDIKFVDRKQKNLLKFLFND